MTSKNLYSETIDGGRINVRYRINEKNKIGIYTEFSTYYPRSTRELFCFTVDGIKTITICQINKKTNHISISTSFSKSSDGGVKNNKGCTSYLGVYIAEQVLSKLFKNVTKMPYGHTGFDFICGKDKKIDVKSACKRKFKPNSWADAWDFTINKNKIADYFYV